MDLDERRQRAATADFALLAPVPAEHLKSGRDVCGKEGRVAFGSNDGMVFAKLLHLLDSDPCRALIYGSHGGPTGLPRATWEGIFLGVTSSLGGMHPNPAVRPPTTASDGKWAIFWEVAELTPLPEPGARLISSLRGQGNAKNFSKQLIPQRPYIIEPY